MAGGSQLKQLKASLKSNGLIGQTNNKKGKKRPNSNHDRKDRERIIQGIREAFNPFDVKVTKQKFDVIGKTVTGARGKPGISKQAGEENRKRAFDVMTKKNKAGGIIDRRFGENDSNMTPEEVMLARFTREKLTGLSKKDSLFNLEDDGEDMLTHYGQSLALTDDFQEDDLGVEEDEETKEILRKRRMMMERGEDEEEDSGAPKSKKEIMQEVIAKSKMYKYERQQAKEEDLHIIDELDSQENINSLLEDLTSFDRQYSGPKTELAQRDQEYEQRVREMAFDRRAQPTDRTKTEEELAKEKAEKIRKLEQDRLARMEGIVYEDEDDIAEQEEDDEEEEGNDATEFGLDVKNFSDDYISEDEEEEDEVDSDGDVDLVSSDSESQKPQRQSKPSYKCPQDLDELTAILKSKSFDEYPKIIKHIIDLYHPSKAEGNKQKLAVFTTVLFDLLQNTTIDSQTFNLLVEILRQLSTDHVELLTEYCREKILEVEEQLSEVRAGASSISASDLLLFSLIGLVFSTSDHFHLVVTSATIVLTQHLSQSSIRSVTDILTSVFISDTLLAYQRISQRYIPEVTLFLQRLLYIFSPQNEGLENDLDLFASDFHYKIDEKALTKLTNTAAATLKLSDFTGPSSHLAERIFLHSMNTISTASNIWRDKLAYIEIFTPITTLLEPLQSIHPTVTSTKSKLDKLIAMSVKQRIPLSLQAHRPLPIQTFAPKFEENYNLDRKSYDPDRERNETKKLKAELKKERKGALRDLRRDNAFISREKIKSKRQTDKEYHDKLARLERTIQTEEGAEKNKYEREKQARKRT